VVFRFLAFNGQKVTMSFNFKLIFSKARNSHRDTVSILAGAFDIIWRVRLGSFRRCERIEHREQRDKTKRVTIERGKIYMTHSKHSIRAASLMIGGSVPILGKCFLPMAPSAATVSNF